MPSKICIAASLLPFYLFVKVYKKLVFVLIEESNSNLIKRKEKRIGEAWEKENNEWIHKRKQETWKRDKEKEKMD